MGKQFDSIYEQAINATSPTNTNAPQAVKKPVLDTGLLKRIQDKMLKAKTDNQPVTLDPSELEAYFQLINPEPTKTEQPQQTPSQPEQQNQKSAASKPLI
jgi:hypothetical protein